MKKNRTYSTAAAQPKADPRPRAHIRAGNVYTTLRAATVPDQRKETSKKACRGLLRDV